MNSHIAEITELQDRGLCAEHPNFVVAESCPSTRARALSPMEAFGVWAVVGHCRGVPMSAWQWGAGCVLCLLSSLTLLPSPLKDVVLGSKALCISPLAFVVNVLYIDSLASPCTLFCHCLI